MATNTSVVRARRGFASLALRLIPTEHRSAAWSKAGELGLAVLGFLSYFLVRGAVVDRAGDALRHARDIIELESALHVFVEPSIQHWVLSYELIRQVCDFVYFWCDFPLIVAVGLVLFWRSRMGYLLLRDTLLTSGAAALLVYVLFPVAPPRFLTEWGFVDTLAIYSNLSYQAQSLRPFVNPFAAVPSLHVGWSLLMVVAVYRATPSRWWRGGVSAVFALQLLAVVGTGNHLFFDAVAGLAICLLALRVTERMQRSGYPTLRRRLDGWARLPDRV
jgi:hypothetical protein